MNEHFKLLIEDLKKIWLKLNINQKFSIAVLLLAVVIIGVFFIVKATEPNWTVLYSDLSKADLAAITESFKKSGHAFKVSEDKTSILVKTQEKEDLMFYVAENDLIKDSSGGFELLDDLQLGSTDFKNKLTKQRIFQGELTRSIEKINGVAKARVQLADPERSIFSDEDEAPSASVVLILKPGVKLKASQILAIKNLVAYSIPRLTNDRVFITDQFGTMLSEDVARNSSDMQTYRTNFEKEAAKKIKDTLETIMGKDNVSVQVSTVMDFNQTRATIESYSPNRDSQGGVISTQQSEKEIYSNPYQDKNSKENVAVNNVNSTEAQNRAENQMANVEDELNQINQEPNADTDVLSAPLNQTAAKTVNYVGENNLSREQEAKKLSYEKEKQATTYAITKEIKQVVYAPGAVVRMSVAVAVNKILTEAEKDEIRSLVQAAAGMDISRGDVVSISSLKFTGIDTQKEEREEKERQRDFILEILSFVFKNVAPVIVILILGGIALANFEKIFNHKEQVVEVEEEESQIPSFDPYLALQQNATNQEDFFQQEIQYTSPVDKKKSEIINTVFANPEEATKVLISYMKE